MPPAFEDASSARAGVLLVGHGTRSEPGRRQCQALAEEIAAGLEPRLLATELAYLELASPTIEQAVARLVEHRVERLIVVPLLLFAAGHAKEDIPAAVRSALATVGIPSLPIMQTEPLGLQQAVIELAANRFQEAADASIRPEETCLLLIGRGSRDAEATADMRQLGELLHQRLGIGQTQVGFLAMVQPSAQDIVQAATTSNFPQIVVQPHLLFYGELLDRLEQGVHAAAAKTPSKTWRMSRVLGDESRPLARILLQGIFAAGNYQNGPTSKLLPSKVW